VAHQLTRQLSPYPQLGMYVAVDMSLNLHINKLILLVNIINVKD